MVGDPVFRDLVLCRVVEPTSKLDSVRGLGGWGPNHRISTRSTTVRIAPGLVETRLVGFDLGEDRVLTVVLRGRMHSALNSEFSASAMALS